MLGAGPCQGPAGPIKNTGHTALWGARDNQADRQPLISGCGLLVGHLLLSSPTPEAEQGLACPLPGSLSVQASHWAGHGVGAGKAYGRMRWKVTPMH